MDDIEIKVDARHPIIAHALRLHGVEPEDVQKQMGHGLTFEFDQKAGRPDIPFVLIGDDRAWVRWKREADVIFYLTPTTFTRRGETRPAQSLEIAGMQLPETVIDSLVGRSVRELVEMAGSDNLRIENLKNGVSRVVAVLAGWTGRDGQ